MSAEERWADRQQWAEEKRQGFDVEIKLVTPIVGRISGATCQINNCQEWSAWLYEVGRTDSRGGIRFEFCEEHADDLNAFKAYKKDQMED